MAHILLFCFILADAFVGLAMASEKVQSMVQSNTASSSNPPAPSPSNGENLYKAQAPLTRKLGKHHHYKMVQSVIAPSLSSSVAPQSEVIKHSTKETGSLGQANSSEPNNEENASIEAERIYLTKRHHSVDKSVAGGGVILGGLATMFLVAVFCYIRATGRHKAETTA